MSANITEKHFMDGEAKYVDVVSVSPSLPSERDVSVQYTKKQERRLVLKQDLVIIPLLAMGYFFGYLDRGNIGNARLMGMPEALHLTAQKYFNILMIFFVGFLVSELPSALLIRVIPAQYVFGGAIMLFGVCSVCMSATGGYAGMMVVRTILGIGEAVLTLGFLYLSLWYKADELAFRCGLIYCSTPVAGFASGLIAYGVQKHLQHTGGYMAWQWLFIIEGIPTIALGLVILVLLPNLPDRTAKKGHFLFKDPKEREIMLQRQLSGQNSAFAPIKFNQILVGLKDPKSYLGGLMVAAPALGITAFSIFLPTFVKEFGYSALNAQIYSIIPYACAIVSTPLFCFASDRLRAKAMPMLFCLGLSVIGLVILLAAESKAGRIIGCCFVAGGAYPAIGIGASWVASMHGGYTKRATAYGISQILVQSYSIIGTEIYNKPPRFIKGHAILLGFYAIAIASTLTLYFWLKKQNRARDTAAAARPEGLRQHGLEVRSPQGFEELYDYHPDFRYPL